MCNEHHNVVTMEPLALAKRMAIRAKEYNASTEKPSEDENSFLFLYSIEQQFYDFFYSFGIVYRVSLYRV